MKWERKADLPTPPRNVLVVPFWLKAQINEIVADSYCPDDRAYVVDSDGHVRPLNIMGRLIDQPPPPEDPDDGD